ncbi:MAG: TIGR00159 family protein, partial [Spirochaetia bacterium]|nr:TIGR00159 family protein [Spirochaetia bacterium]
MIVAYVVYRGYILLSRTRAIQLLIGFGMILLLDVIARRLNLETVSWLITNVSSYLVFGLIVLLQPELRRLVAEIGRMRIFQWVNPRTVLPLDEIVEAARSMASTRTGSIMVIQNTNRLESIIENAVRVDAVVTRELLETIFHKDTPLHDGAVVIEGGRIVAASCYLPLSSSRTLKKTHGARHRAGMGISEETDAVVVVTSEETGRI